jgi:hypothetical protein
MPDWWSPPLFEKQKCQRKGTKIRRNDDDDDDDIYKNAWFESRQMYRLS